MKAVVVNSSLIGSNIFPVGKEFEVEANNLSCDLFNVIVMTKKFFSKEMKRDEYSAIAGRDGSIFVKGAFSPLAELKFID